MYKIIKKILTFFPIVGLLVFVFPEKYSLFGEWAWYFLVFLMYVRPLRDLFPKCFVFSKSVTLRKELGIISGVLALSHVVGYFLNNKLPALFFFDSIMWNPRGYLGWGTLAFVLSLILLFTSNVFSMKKLGRYWKKIQRLSYLMFLFVGIHIILIKDDEVILTSVILILYIVLYILAYLKKKK